MGRSAKPGSGVDGLPLIDTRSAVTSRPTAPRPRALGPVSAFMKTLTPEAAARYRDARLGAVKKAGGDSRKLGRLLSGGCFFFLFFLTCWVFFLFFRY